MQTRLPARTAITSRLGSTTASRSRRSRTSAATGVPTGEFILGYPNHYGIMPPTPVVPAAARSDGAAAAARQPVSCVASALRDLGLQRIVRRLSEAPAGRRRLLAVHEARDAARDGRTEDAPSMVWLASRWSGAGRAARRWWWRPTPTIRSAAPRRFRLRRRSRRVWPARRRAHPPDQSARRPQAVPGRAVAAACRTPTGCCGARASSARRCSTPRILERCGAGRVPRGAAALDDDGQARGIHFFCVNASIRSQFEFVQQTWCNNPRFGGLYDNKDPITGDNERTDQPPRHMTFPARRSAAHRSAAAVRDGARRRLSLHAWPHRAAVSGGGCRGELNQRSALTADRVELVPARRGCRR